MAKMGRPPLAEGQGQTEVLRFRIRADHSSIIRQAAKDAGLSASGWMRDRLLKAARRELLR